MAQNMGDNYTCIEFTMQSHDYVTHHVTTSLCSVDLSLCSVVT